MLVVQEFYNETHTVKTDNMVSDKDDFDKPLEWMGTIYKVENFVPPAREEAHER